MNVRELGGLPTADGSETRFGSVVRADSVSQLSEEGWRALVGHGIRTVIDLRGDHEREEDPPAELPVEVVHVPFMEASEAEWEVIAEEIEAAAAAAPDVATSTRDVYLIFLERFRDNVAAAVRAVAHAPEGGVVIHCVGGKDRTGLLAALLLRVAGVPPDVIADDYALTEAALAPVQARWIAAAPDEAERRRRILLEPAPAAAMRRLLEELDARHGGVPEYLRGAGVSDDELARVRNRLVAA